MNNYVSGGGFSKCFWLLLLWTEYERNRKIFMWCINGYLNVINMLFTCIYFSYIKYFHDFSAWWLFCTDLPLQVPTAKKGWWPLRYRFVSSTNSSNIHGLNRYLDHPDLLPD
jgi:hypothetical protein